MLLVALAFLLLVLRNAGLYTVVSSDESTYSKLARLLPLASATIPDYVYFRIYRFTNICGAEFLGCAKILNALFFVAATPFVYLTARRYCSSVTSLAISALTLIGPINTYTSYFMPESMYFFGFWVLTWHLLRQTPKSGSRHWGVAGVLLGMTALVKPHALLMLPGLVAYVVFACKEGDGRWLPRASRNAGIFLASTLITKLVIGYVLAGKAGLNPFGAFYSSIAS
jgi:phosphoglycerol transferase